MAELKKAQALKERLKKIVDSNFAGRPVTESVSPKYSREINALSVGSYITLPTYTNTMTKYKVLAVLGMSKEKALLVQNEQIEIVLFRNRVGSWSKKY